MTTDLKDKFDMIRQAIKEHPDQGGSPLAFAALDVVEELLSKLERIAVAAEKHLELAERHQ